METSAPLDQFWSQRTEDVRAFLERHPKYEKLCEEVAYVLERAIRNKTVEYASVSFRPKTLGSFCEKVIRKAYKKPLEENTDFAGVRIVYLYASDRTKIESLIAREFAIIETIDKADKTDPERFGYGALHYLVKLKKKSSGIRYDDLKDLVCEIQVRTILQDAWAIVAHHLNYKQESDVPLELRRKLNALSGLFETADSQFDLLKDDRIAYKKKVRELIKTDKIDVLENDINLDNLIAYLLGRFPDRQLDDPESAADLLVELKRHGYNKLKQLDDIVSRAYDAAIAYEKKYPPRVMSDQEPVFTPVGMVRNCLDLVDKKYFESRGYSEKTQVSVKEFVYLVKK
jgi:ppGpp synthetase/RelA/SpoT-type nucleotidyltranferase